MKYIFFLSFLILFQFIVLPQNYESYIAHIAAANSSLRLDEKSDAKRWIDNTPKNYRGWEWEYLSRNSDRSLVKFELKEGTPAKLAVSPSGKIIAFGDSKGLIHLLESDSMRELTEIRGHSAAVYSVKFSPDEQSLISCSRDSTIKIWDISTGSEIRSIFAGGYGLADIDISPDGKSILYCSWYLKDGVKGFVRLYDFVTGEKNWETEYNTHPLVAARFSPDGKLFAIGSWEWNVAVWRISELQSPPKIFDFNDVPSYSAVDDLAFSPDSKLIAAATKNTVPRIWNIENKSELMELKGHRKPVLSVAWSRDGSIVYTSGDDGTIVAWNSKTAASTGKLFGHDDRITSIVVSPESGILYSSSADGTVRKWDTQPLNYFTQTEFRNRVIYAFSLDKKGERLVTNGPDSSLTVWSTITGKQLITFNALNNLVNDAVFSPDGKIIAACNWSKIIRLFDSKSGLLLKELVGMGGGSPKIRFSPDGKQCAAVSTEKAVCVWDVESGKMTGNLPLESRPFSLAYSPDGKYLISGEANGTVTIIDAEKMVEKVSFKAGSVSIHAIKVDKNNKYLFTGGDDRVVRKWDFNTLEMVKEYAGHSQRVYCLDISPDEKRMITGSSDLTVKFWDIETGVQLLTLSDFTNPIYNVIYFPHGKSFIVNSSGNEIKIYSTE